MEAEIWDDEDEDEGSGGTFEHGFICATLARELGNFVKEHNLGRVGDRSLEYQLFVSPDPTKNNTQPDISFIAAHRLPANFRTYPEIVPDFAADVISPVDTIYEIEAKVELYQRHGVKLIWTIHPYSRIVKVYTATENFWQQCFGEGDELDGYDVIPGLKMPVSVIFDYPPIADDF